MSKVLVAEDEPALLESYSELVTGLGHECLAAQDGHQALALARQHRPDLVVTDFMLPGRTGLEVLRELRADPLLGKVPVILMSAGRPPESARQEAWLFLAKPVSLEGFEKALLDGLKASAASALPQGFVPGAPENISPISLAREEMLNWVSHEIKSPLTAAMTSSQLAMRALRNNEAPAALERRLIVIARQLTRMEELVNSILDAAQLQEGRLRLELEELEVSEWLRGITSFWRELHPDYDFVLADVPEVRMEGDGERLRQVLDNLISNAIKYGHPSKVVRLSVQPTEQSIAISVQDEGKGIPPEELPRLFDRFHRVAGQGGRGHGLGLYIATALTRMHGGNISVQSELGRGSTFTVLLPRQVLARQPLRASREHVPREGQGT